MDPLSLVIVASPSGFHARCHESACAPRPSARFDDLRQVVVGKAVVHMVITVG